MCEQGLRYLSWDIVWSQITFDDLKILEHSFYFVVFFVRQVFGFFMVWAWIFALLQLNQSFESPKMGLVQ
jgi:hypothetical protein